MGKLLTLTTATASLAGLALSLAPAGANAAAAPASGADPGGRVTVFTKLEAKHSGKVVGISGGSTAIGARAIQASFFGDLNQQWEKIHVSSVSANGDSRNTPSFILKNRNSRMCLDIEGGGRGVVGSPLVQAPCDGTPSQRWYVHKLVDDGLFTGKGYRYFFNDLSEQVMDVAGASLSTGALIVQFPKKPLSSSGNQLFNQGFGGVG